MTRSPLQPIIQFAASKRGAKLVLVGWLLLIVLLSAAAPTAKQFAISAGEGHVDGNTPSAIAKQLLDEQHTTSEGLPALLVFHQENGAIDAAAEQQIIAFSEWLASAERPQAIASAVPFHTLPAAARAGLFGADHSTVLLMVSLQDHLTTDEMLKALDEVKARWEENAPPQLKLDLTGPAAIASDTLTLFRNADFVLMIATVVLILILLIVIYRSPLLAIFPLIIAGIVYAAVDRIIGLSGKLGLFEIDKQSLSIMMILLFAVITDYCLFVFSRYREALRTEASKYAAMGAAMTHVAEPILFSGGTVLIAMLTLFTAVFKPYNGFAPVFSIAVAVILLAGLTLIPALFALVGRKAFWPFVPKAGETSQLQHSKRSLWEKIGTFVTQKPKTVLIVILLPLLAAAGNAWNIQFSFNLLKSFPADTSSRAGFELLEQHYPVGELAPVTVMLHADQPMTADDELAQRVRALMAQLRQDGKIDRLQPNPDQLDVTKVASMLGDDKQTLTFTAVLHTHPYEQEALDLLAKWRQDSNTILNSSGFDSVRDALHFAGQTAEQLDVRTMNERDTIIIFALIALLITIMLAFQTRSIVMPIYMMLTILVSYAATIGISWLVFHYGFNFESFSYRLPVYTFVFMVALGVDYNIMLVSRIKEEAHKHSWRDAVRNGVAATGGVISSAGIILAATFGVLITQPVQELYLFGFAMAAGILIDTFLVRGMLLPAIMTIGFKPKQQTQAGGH
ncbi:MMPL family transporter [Paenibacillus sp. GCM10027626]|uniref:MMPL family transporter n=1 Tax=Paenibacillus sp. GCM10027626 TaxID=3273411 RepID=UPI003633F6B3